MRFFERVTKRSVWIIIPASIIISEVLTAGIVSVMSVVLRGKITQDYLVTGAVAALLVSAFVVSLIVFFLHNLLEAQEALRKRTSDLERLNRVMVGRELEMVRMKDEIDRLKGKPEKGA